MSRALTARAPRRRIFRRPTPLRAGEASRVLPLLLPVTTLSAVAVGSALGALVVDRPSVAVVAGALGLLAAAVVAEAFPFPIEGVTGATSLATVFIVAATVLYGWEVGTIVAFLTMIVVELARRRPLVRTSYNTALYVCGGIAAGVVVSVVPAESLGALVARTLLAATAFYVANIALLGAVVARARDEPFLKTERQYFTSTSVPFVVLASLSATLVLLWEQSPFVAIVLVGPLLAIGFYQRWLHGALERLREFDRLKDEFIAVISHELRTPLTSVYGAAVTLQEHTLDEKTQRALLKIISSEAHRLARLLDDVLWASRLDTGRDATRVEPVDAAAVAAQVAEAARSRLPNTLSLEVDVPERPPLVAADPDRLRQVLVNLVDNAVKYSPEGGRISVRLDRAGRDVRFSVTDEGLGIPEREQERVFEKFHRLDPNMSRGVGGTGLGLYICRELVQKMGGSIWVDSEEGRGSTFAFALPTARSPREGMSGEAQQPI